MSKPAAAKHSADAPSEIVQQAQRQQDRQSAAEREKYGERLNTVNPAVCPDCGRTQRMTVHPGHRLYQLCKHAFPLPPLPAQTPHSSRRQSGKARR